VDARALLLIAGPEGPTLWCATSAGLQAVRMDPEFGLLLSRLDAEHGLPSSNLFALQKRAHGELVLGSNRGVAFYQPGVIPPRLRLLRVIGRRSYLAEEWESGLRLEYPQNSLLIEVAATSSRSSPEEFQYAFSLQDDAGHALLSKVSRDPALLTGPLKPGAYRLAVRAFNRDLLASAPGVLRFEWRAPRSPGSPWPWVPCCCWR
jgi:hypothetical protein